METNSVAHQTKASGQHCAVTSVCRCELKQDKNASSFSLSVWQTDITDWSPNALSCALTLDLNSVWTPLTMSPPSLSPRLSLRPGPDSALVYRMLRCGHGGGPCSETERLSVCLPLSQCNPLCSLQTTPIWRGRGLCNHQNDSPLHTDIQYTLSTFYIFVCFFFSDLSFIRSSFHFTVMYVSPVFL